MMFDSCYLSYVVAMTYCYFQHIGLGPTTDVLCYFLRIILVVRSLLSLLFA